MASQALRFVLGGKVENKPNQKSKNRIVLLSSIVLVIFALALMFIQLRQNGLTTEGSIIESADFAQSTASELSIPDGLGGLQVGDTAPDFTLLNRNGDPVSLSDYAGQPIMVNFWATWCAPCRVEMPHMQAAYEAHKDQGFEILALDQDENMEIVGEYFDELGLTFTPLLDVNFVVASEYGAAGIYPSSYFIDRDGTIAHVHRGPATEDQLNAFINEIIP